MNKIARDHFLKTPGWLREEEAVLLYFIAEKAKIETNGIGVAVEFGSFLGKSSGVIAVASYGLVCIDPWDWDPNNLPPGIIPEMTDFETPIREQFLNNVSDLDNIELWTGKSSKCLEWMGNNIGINIGVGVCGLVYIDANHYYIDVLNDILLAKQLHPKYLALHDYGDPQWLGVKQAADEILGNEPDYLAGRLAVFKL